MQNTYYNSKPKKIQTKDNEQHNFHTDPCTAYVQISYHHHLNVT